MTLSVRSLIPLVLLAACAPTYAYSPAGSTQPPARDVHCEIEVLTSQPLRAYREIGTFDHTRGEDLVSASELRATLGQEACKAGADALLVQTASSYRRAVAIVWVDPPAPVTPTASAP